MGGKKKADKNQNKKNKNPHQNTALHHSTGPDETKSDATSAQPAIHLVDINILFSHDELIELLNQSAKASQVPDAPLYYYRFDLRSTHGESCPNIITPFLTHLFVHFVEKVAGIEGAGGWTLSADDWNRWHTVDMARAQRSGTCMRMREVFTNPDYTISIPELGFLDLFHPGSKEQLINAIMVRVQYILNSGQPGALRDLPYQAVMLGDGCKLPMYFLLKRYYGVLPKEDYPIAADIESYVMPLLIHDKVGVFSVNAMLADKPGEWCVQIFNKQGALVDSARWGLPQISIFAGLGCIGEELVVQQSWGFWQQQNISFLEVCKFSSEAFKAICVAMLKRHGSVFESHVKAIEETGPYYSMMDHAYAQVPLLNAQILILEGQLEALKASAVKAESTINLQKKLNVANALVATCQKERDAAQARGDQLNEQLESAYEGAKNLKSQIQSSDVKIEKLKAIITELRTQNQTLKTDNQALQAQNQALSAQREQERPRNSFSLYSAAVGTPCDAKSSEAVKHLTEALSCWQPP